MDEAQARPVPTAPQEPPKPQNEVPRFQAHIPPKILKAPRMENTSGHPHRDVSPAPHVENRTGNLRASQMSENPILL